MTPRQRKTLSHKNVKLYRENFYGWNTFLLNLEGMNPLTSDTAYRGLNFLIKLVDIKKSFESVIVQMAKCVQYAVVTL